MYEVAEALKKCKKPKSRVRGDIFPHLIGPNADILALPLSHIFNQTISRNEWQAGWKEETFVVIPKPVLLNR